MWPFKRKPKSKKIFTLGGIVVQLNKLDNTVAFLKGFTNMMILPVDSIDNIIWKKRSMFNDYLEVYGNGTLIHSVSAPFMASLQDVQECSQYLKEYKKSLKLLEAEQIINY